jgi:hypothetical protein
MSRIWPLAGVVNLGLQAPNFADKYLRSVTEKWKTRYTKQQSANCQLKQHKMSEKLGFLKSKRPFYPKSRSNSLGGQFNKPRRKCRKERKVQNSRKRRQTKSSRAELRRDMEMLQIGEFPAFLISLNCPFFPTARLNKILRDIFCEIKTQERYKRKYFSK